MARPAIPSVAVDFDRVMAFLEAKKIVPAKRSVALNTNAKRIHRATFSLILWRFRLRRLPPNSSAFIEEIASDALQILPQVMMGYGKTAKLLTRGVLENVLRHLYFSDHPIEFDKMNRNVPWHMRVVDLIAYLKDHPLFSESEQKFDAIARFAALYSDLSAGIHGRQVTDLEMRAALQKIKYSDEKAEEEMALIERCAESSNFLLAVFHGKKLAKFEAEDQRIILRTMPPRARRAWSEML